MTEEELQILVDKGKTNGFLTVGEINDLISERFVDLEEVDEIVFLLKEIGIKLIDEQKHKKITEKSKKSILSDPYVIDVFEIISKYKGEKAWEKIIPFLKDDIALIRAEAAKAIGTIKSDHSIVHLSELLNDSNPDVKKTAVRTLIIIDNPQSTNYLIPHLQDGDKEFKALVSIALGRLGESIAYSTLVELVNDIEINNNFRTKMLQALCVLGDRRCVPLILKYLIDMSLNAFEIKNILKFLHLIPDKSFIPILNSFTDHYNPQIKLSSILNLCRLKQKRGFILLENYLNDANGATKISVIKNLLFFGGKKYLNHGFEALECPDGTVQRSVMNSIIQCTENEFNLISKILPKLDLNEDLPFSLNFKILKYINELQTNLRPINFKKLDLKIVCRLLNFIGYFEEISFIEESIKNIKQEQNFQPKIEKFLEEESVEDGFEDYDEEDIKKIRAKFQFRPNQRSYREKTFKRYGESCAVCGMKIKALLEAAHIISKKEKGTDDPRNGLTLCTLHHKAYDSELFSIEPNTFKIVSKKNGPKLNDLKITYNDITHLNRKPDSEILKWEWNKWIKTEE